MTEDEKREELLRLLFDESTEQEPAYNSNYMYGDDAVEPHLTSGEDSRNAQSDQKTIG